MGASESTGRPNAAENDGEERRQQESSGAAKVIAVAAAGAAVAAWGISKMLADNTESHEKDDIMQGMQYRSAKGQSSTGYGGSNHDDSDFTYEGAATKQNSMWLRPPRGGFKMNTDGISRPNPGPSAYAGILRNDRGEWVRGFVGFLGDAEIHTSEIYGIYEGLKLLVKLKMKGCVLESDSKEAVFWTRKENKSYEHPEKAMPHCSDKIIECWKLASENNIFIEHIGGDANVCADELAEVALELKRAYVEIQELPLRIKDIVDKERVPTFLA